MEPERIIRAVRSIQWGRIFFWIYAAVVGLLIWHFISLQIAALASIYLPPAEVTLGMIAFLTCVFFVVSILTFRNESTIHSMITFTFLLIIGVGISFGYDAITLENSLTGAAILTGCLMAFWVFNQLPFFIIVFIITLSAAFFFLAIVPLFFLGGGGTSMRGLFPTGQLYAFNPFLMFFIPCLIFGCAYFPRNIELRRYLVPLADKPYFSTRRSEEEGFTLIELLIVIAIIGIMTGGMLHCWGYVVHTQVGLQQRIQITEIMSSEMDAVLAQAELPPPSPENHPLPIALSEFSERIKAKGYYLISVTDEPDLLKITVRMTHEIESLGKRYYRLVAYRRADRGGQE